MNERNGGERRVTIKEGIGETKGEMTNTREEEGEGERELGKEKISVEGLCSGLRGPTSVDFLSALED